MVRISHVLILLVLSHFSLAMGTTPQCRSSCEEELSLSLYAHQVGSGANQNQDVIVSPGFPNQFCVLAVNNWDVRAAPSPSASIVARARGMHVQADHINGFDWFLPFSMVFQDSRFGGSTLQVMGTVGATNEWAIVGGTGNLSMARGTIKYKTTTSTSVENYRQIDIHAFYTPTPTV